MKKLILIPLLATLFLASCKEENEETVPMPVSAIDADMRGDWTNTSVKRVYYGDGDRVMYSDSSIREAYFNFDGRRMTVTLPNSSERDVWEYSFPDANDSTYIQLKQGNVTTDYLIKTLSDTVMVWEDEEAWAGFPHNVPDDEKTTSRVGVYTWKFVRRN
ncbi:hypothetical protein [Pontibacter harenae]|uniref:hypothetical protein n=1 Tax=Pontibacter harenae TaxID=2894083 RepID=UPI001E38162F|nr:hypothetical protein [Pontibacter harenae]MCC9168090.1 hypothetical protein [Pontibacter harenae]